MTTATAHPETGTYILTAAIGHRALVCAWPLTCVILVAPPYKVGSVVPILQSRKLRLRKVSSSIERELDGGIATNTEQKKKGDREMKTRVEN